jgi:hypothetical protein
VIWGVVLIVVGLLSTPAGQHLRLTPTIPELTPRSAI